MRKRSLLALFVLLVASLALMAAGCGGDDEGDGGGGGGGITALPSSSCTGIEYKGEGDPDYLLVSDFPLQGSSRTQTTQIVGAIRYLLDQSDWKAGDHKIAYQSCDDATAQAAKWDSGKCSQNANAYAGNDKVIGVIGTFNSGCAAIEIPVLNQAANGGIGMISPANTFVCLIEPESNRFGLINAFTNAPAEAWTASADRDGTVCRDVVGSSVTIVLSSNLKPGKKQLGFFIFVMR